MDTSSTSKTLHHPRYHHLEGILCREFATIMIQCLRYLGCYAESISRVLESYEMGGIISDVTHLLHRGARFRQYHECGLCRWPARTSSPRWYRHYRLCGREANTVRSNCQLDRTFIPMWNRERHHSWAPKNHHDRWSRSSSILRMGREDILPTEAKVPDPIYVYGFPQKCFPWSWSQIRSLIHRCVQTFGFLRYLINF